MHHVNLNSATNIGFEPKRIRKIERMKASERANREGRRFALSEDQMRLIRVFGQRQHEGNGRICFLMTANAMRSLARTVGRAPDLDRLSGRYIIVGVDDETTIITTGYRF